MASSVFIRKWKTWEKSKKIAKVLKLSYVGHPFNLDSVFWSYIHLNYPSEWILLSEQGCLPPCLESSSLFCCLMLGIDLCHFLTLELELP